jgi:hypothetical protein
MNKKQMNELGIKEVEVIYATKNYEIFNLHKSNRELHQSKKLLTSIRESGIKQPIRVGEDFTVLDGQNRLWAAKRLGMAVPFVISKVDNSLKDIIDLNTTQRGWSIGDYVESYVAEGLQSYIHLKDVRDEFDMTYSTLAAVFGVLGGIDTQGKDTRLVKEGKFSTTYKIAEKARNMLTDLSEFKRSTGTVSMTRDFVIAYADMWRHPRFDNERMISNSNKTDLLMSISGSSDPVRIKFIMSDIFNHRLQKEVNKILVAKKSKARAYFI